MLRHLGFLTALFAPLSAADLSGAWSGTLAVSGGQPFRIELRRSAPGLTGFAAMRQDFLTVLEHLEQNEAKLTFQMRTMGGMASFQAVADGDRLTGTMSTAGAPEPSRFELTRSGHRTWPAPRIDLARGKDVASLSDEFDSPETLKRWTNLSDAERLPQRFESESIDGGLLRLLPNSGAWWAGYHGGFLYKEVTGDFVITTRLKVTSRSGDEPSQIWTISGLLIRALRSDNWLYLMTGRGPGTSRVIDAKSTIDGRNVWDIVPAQPGWYELRIARFGPYFIEFTRPEGGAWTERKRIFRPDLPNTLQAGINVTSDFTVSASMRPAEYNARLFPDKSKRDNLTLVDYVRFSLPIDEPALVQHIQ